MCQPDIEQVACGKGSLDKPRCGGFAAIGVKRSIISFICISSAITASCHFTSSYSAQQDGSDVRNMDVLGNGRKLRTQNEVDTDKRKMAWIHIGKCGGTTIESMLRYGCPTHRLQEGKCHVSEKYLETHVESTVSKTVEQTFHVEPPEYEPFTSFLVSTRDPLDRTVSAFLMHHPKNGVPGLIRDQDFIFDCFPTLEDFGMALGGKVTGPAEVVDVRDGSKHDCTKLAKALVLGRVGQAIEKAEIGHVFWNYDMYVGQMPLTKEVFAIRMTYLWSDFAKINSMLGGEDDRDYMPSQEHARDSSTLQYEVSKTLSAESQKYICEHLSAEYQLYFGILDRAVNLSDDEVKETKMASWKTCPELFSSESEVL